MAASLSELVLGWETHFELDELLDHSDHYRRTFRAWTLAFRAQAERGDRAGRAGADTDLRAVLRSRRGRCSGSASTRCTGSSSPSGPSRRRGSSPLRPSDLATEPVAGSAPAGASAAGDPRALRRVERLLPAVARPVDDVLARGCGATETTAADLDGGAATQDRLLRLARPRRRCRWAPDARVLDVGCGWGGTLRRLVEAHGVGQARRAHAEPRAARRTSTARPDARVEVRLEDWRDHRPTTPYDGIVSFGAFEHFARDGSDGPERVAAYRRFFATAADWLVPGGRLGLETIAHDGAPDTASPAWPRSPRRLRARSVPGVDVPAPGRDRARLRAVVRGGGAARRRRRLRPHVPALARRRCASNEDAAAELVGPTTVVRTFQPLPGRVGGPVPDPDDHQLPGRPAPSRPGRGSDAHD